MGTSTVYLIWYGNWNQANGSDTSAGQAIIRDFLYELNNSPYYQINASYGTPTGFVNLMTCHQIVTGSKHQFGRSP